MILPMRYTNAHAYYHVTGIDYTGIIYYSLVSSLTQSWDGPEYTQVAIDVIMAMIACMLPA